MSRRGVSVTHLLAALTTATSFALSGFTFVPDIDPTNHKNVPTYNNARLNDSAVTPTAFVPRPDLAVRLAAAVPGVHYAVVLQRRRALFVGIDDTRAAGEPRVNLAVAKAWLSRQVPDMTRVYVSTDPTLINHFHRYSEDRSAHLRTGSDVILSDIERDFPGAR